MLTPKQFGTQSAKARYDIVISAGTYLNTILATERAIHFYCLYGFIVEVWKDAMNGKLLKVEATPLAQYKKVYEQYGCCLN